MKKQETTPFLVAANLHYANDFLREVEEKYLPAVNQLAQMISGKGVALDANLVRQTVQGNYEPLEKAYREYVTAGLKDYGPVIQKQLDEAVDTDLEELKNFASQVLSGYVGTDYTRMQLTFKELAGKFYPLGYVSMRDETLAQQLEVDGDGVVFIPDEKMIFLRESFQYYCHDPEKAKVYEAQQKAADALNDFCQALIKIGGPAPSMPGLFVNTFFPVVQFSESDIQFVAGRTHFDY